MTEKKVIFNNINIKSTKSQTQDIKDFQNEIILEEPQQFDCLIKKDKTQENQNEDISNLNINNELQNKIKNIKINDEIETRKTKPKYFEDINNSSIVKKEESISEFNTNKKSQGSDFALFKMMNGLGNENSGSKIKTLESLEKFDPLNSINSQFQNIINSKNNKKTEREEGKENKDEIFKIEEENIKTNDYAKSENSDFIQKEKDEDEKTNINKMNVELFFKPNEENQDDYIKDTRNQIVNDINNLYENNELNLVKLNNKEIFNFVTEYNPLSKDNLDYNPNYYKLTDINDNFISRRNNFLSHNYFSYIIKEKSQENTYSYEKIKKYKINYEEKKPEFNFNKSSSILNSKLKNNKIKREPKVNDIENISSFFYNFCLYYPQNNENNKNPKTKILDEQTEEEIINLICSYRKIYNDGRSFQRSFSFLLLETFLLKNKLNEINYILYDIKKTLKNKFLNIDQALNILYQIKENDSINDLMDSFNSTEINIDEIMINYIEDKINIINKIDTINKRKYQEINYIYLKTLCDLFDINLKIFSIEENKSKNKVNNNSFLSLNTLNINCESYEINKNNSNVTDSSRSGELNKNYPTLNILFFLNSYHIIYSNKSDIDSTLANNELSLQHYYLPSLPNYLCPKCKKNEPLDIIPFYEAVFCHKCLNNHMKEIIKNRVVSFIKSGFSSVEYFTRPIGIKSEIKVNSTLYKYITGNYLIKDFEYIFNNTCFICHRFYNINKKKSDKNINISNLINNIKVIKLKCRCQICENCIEDLRKKFMGDFNCLNLYEIHNLKLTKCPCGNVYDLNELMNLSKIKFSAEDKKLAIQRLKLILQKKCCICLENKEENIKYINLTILNSPNHFICIDCFKKKTATKNNNINKNMEIKHEKKDDKNNKIYYNDLESSDSSLKDIGGNDKKIFCNICFTEHIITQDSENKNIQKKNKSNKSTNRCCGKCLIF